jgi:hypothetical protein
MPERSGRPLPVPDAPLGEIIRMKFNLRITCGSCLHMTVIKPSSLIARHGSGRSLRTLRFRCSACGSRSGRPELAP